MKTWHIHIEGQVQGVGFRPFVYLLAAEFDLQGWVNNTTDGVHIEFNADEETASYFYKTILQNPPALSSISYHRLEKAAPECYSGFQIVESNADYEPSLWITPDFAMCADCRVELHTQGNQRHNYAFITCTHCGPRYSIIKNLPYDRENTSMHHFHMCPGCGKEYRNPADRRYFAQTNSCPDCPVTLSLINSKGKNISQNQDEIIEQATALWKAGKIIAVKGIGGYILMCDAENDKAIKELRKRKQRPTKPFAVMYPNLAQLAFDFECNETEKKLLSSTVAPIVLLDQKSGKQHLSMQIAPHLQQTGVMLPYTPLFDLLLTHFGKPVVATSGNVTESPILYEDDTARKQLSGIADFLIQHDRQIIVSQDDSVISLTPVKKQKIILRRSRGLAPTYYDPHMRFPVDHILATGAMMKSTFSYWHKDHVYISPYLGDLGQFETAVHFKKAIDHTLHLFRSQPQLIICDKHPDFPSTHYGEQLARELHIPVKHVQHHVAHFAAILGEHGLIESPSPILGVIWDGVGLGYDGQIWGGEFFTYDQYEFRRNLHFDYFDFILGDKMSREPRLAALSACWHIEGVKNFLQKKFSNTEWQIYSKLLDRKYSLKTSSVGRLFDAVSSLLGIIDIQTYEGEAAMRLEVLATQFFKKHGLDYIKPYFSQNALELNMPGKIMLEGIVHDLKHQRSAQYIAARFHFSLVCLIKAVAKELEVDRIAFSGGVFQNQMLVDLLIHHLQPDHKLYFHERLSPNDENISYGQLVYYQVQNEKQSITSHERIKHEVFN